MITIYALLIAAAIFLVCSAFYLEALSDAELAIAAIMAPLFGAAFAALYAAYSWLKFGEVRALATADALKEIGFRVGAEMPSTGWIGLDKLSSWIGALNVGWAFLFYAFVVAFSTFYWLEKGDTSRHERRLMREANSAKNPRIGSP